MAKHVVVVASGETERRALPHLVSHLRSQGIHVVEVRIPARNRPLNIANAEKLIKAAWYGHSGKPPDKIVLLVDVDGKDPVEALRLFEEQLPGRLGSDVRASIQYAYAQWHLEAWYFADAANLRKYLGRDLGSIDPTRPDEIENPKLHLKHLLTDTRPIQYTAVIAEEIARSLDAQTMAQRSPSFLGFLDAVVNGHQVAGCA